MGSRDLGLTRFFFPTLAHTARDDFCSLQNKELWITSFYYGVHTHICRYLSLFVLICRYLSLFFIICPYFSIIWISDIVGYPQADQTGLWFDLWRKGHFLLDRVGMAETIIRTARSASQIGP